MCPCYIPLCLSILKTACKVTKNFWNMQENSYFFAFLHKKVLHPFILLPPSLCKNRYTFLLPPRDFLTSFSPPLHAINSSPKLAGEEATRFVASSSSAAGAGSARIQNQPQRAEGVCPILPIQPIKPIESTPFFAIHSRKSLKMS